MQRLFFLRIKDVEDRAVGANGGFLPVAPFERAFGIDQDVGDVLDVADLMLAPDLQQRVVFGGSGSVGLNSRTWKRAPGDCQFSPLMS